MTDQVTVLPKQPSPYLRTIPRSTLEWSLIEPNRGKGFAVRAGLKESRANVALFSDADLSTPIDEMHKLLRPIQLGEFDVTFGSRALDRTLIGTHQPWRREQGGKVMNLIIRKMSGVAIR